MRSDRPHPATTGSVSDGPAHRRVAGGFTVIEILAVTAMIGAMAVLALPKIMASVQKAKVARAVGDIRALQQDVDAQDTLPADLGVIGRAGLSDPWGRPYQYRPSGGRADRFGVSLNRTYDLFSAGEDGAPDNGDDVVRANDGAYIGLMSRY